MHTGPRIVLWDVSRKTGDRNITALVLTQNSFSFFTLIPSFYILKGFNGLKLNYNLIYKFSKFINKFSKT